MSDVNVAFKSWAAGVFDIRGHIFVSAKGRVRLRIQMPRGRIGYKLKAIYGGSVYRSRRQFKGAAWTYELNAQEDVQRFVHDTLPHSRAQRTPLVSVARFLNESNDAEYTRKLLSNFYEWWFATEKREE